MNSSGTALAEQEPAARQNGKAKSGKPGVCGPSPTKSRTRRTKAEMAVIRRAIREVAKKYQPLTVRQAFYRLVVLKVIQKLESEYKKTVGRLLVDMRMKGEIPFGWITDNTRWILKPASYSSLTHMLQHSQATYRRALWDDQDVYVEVWAESDAVAGVLHDATRQWDVPLMVARGYSSISFLHSAAEQIKATGKPAYLYHFGDYDPSGRDIARDIEAKIRKFAPDAEVHFETVAVTWQQVKRWRLPGAPPKKTDSRRKSFRATRTVEIEAIEPDKLRELVSDCITQHIDTTVLGRMQAVEGLERETLETMIDRLASEEVDE